MKPSESASRSESFNEWWYDYRLKNGLGDHTAKAEVALAAFNAGQQVSNSAQAAGTQSAHADTAPVSERGLSREPTEVMVQSVRGIKIQPEMVRVIWRSMWDAAQSNERNWT